MIFVCSLNDVNTLCSSIGAKYLISVIDPGYAPETPKCVNNHLKLGFDDILEVNNSNKIPVFFILLCFNRFIKKYSNRYK